MTISIIGTFATCEVDSAQATNALILPPGSTMSL